MSDKIPDEILAAAEKATRHGGDGSWIKDPMEAYLQCYRDLTSGGPDGWCAMREPREFNLCSLNAIDAQTAEMLHVDTENGGEDYGEESPEDAWNKAEGEGWRVVPVKLLKVGE